MIMAFLATAQDLTLMTYNIRYATVNDGDNQWENRKDDLSQQIRFYSPDIFGIQEGLNFQVVFLEDNLSEYNYVGVGRDDGQEKGEYCAVFYKKEKFQLLAQRTFWLSESPDKVSKGWDAAYERISTYALLKDKSTGKSFWVFNTHFDHIGKVARENSVKLIVEKIHQINKDHLPVFILGDFNLNEKSEPIRYMTEYFDDSRQLSIEKPFGPFGTFTGFEFHEPVQDRIDYIFCSKENVRVKKYAVLTDSKASRYPSDHFPVFIQVELK